MPKKTVDTATRKNITASLEHLTGPARGTATWLSGAALDVSLSDNRLVRITESGGETPQGDIIARLHRSEETYEIEAPEAHPLWVNGERTSAKRLEHRDLIELGDTGPLSRFQLYREGSRVRKSVADIVGDCIDYTRVSRKPMGVRVGRAFRDLFLGFARQTTVLFRLSVIAAIVILAAITLQQSRSTVRLQQQVESEAKRLESFASALTRTKEEALRPGDLSALRQELSHRLSAATERLVVLEERSDASARVIASAMQSIVFLQGAYGFRETTTNRMLRHAVDDEGRSLVSPRGQPVLTLEGDGPVAERQFTGTAFVVSDRGALLTNRHVALPWEYDASVEALGEQGMEPVSIKFIGYLPDTREPFPVELLKASDDADLAVLLCRGVTGGIPHLALSDTPPKPGDEVIVMGYPTGLRSMLAQTGDAFIEKLQTGENLDFWAVAARLSEEQFIHPLASRGIVGQVTRATVVYDAETTHGGSGGPVLDINGNVIAVNAAIIPEYGGSNLGVPAEYARRLLEGADVR
jgi:S1-C subfamily serine protease